MKREIDTYGKNGVITITGNPQESVLYLKDQPIQYSWLAEIGSTWRYHIAQGLDKQSISVNYEIARILKAGIQNEGDFLGVTEYFAQFLTYGKYEMGYFQLFKNLYWIDIPKDKNYKSFDHYGGGFNISPTQNHIDEELVDEYTELILKGGQPAMVIIHVENSRLFYILDGHHKFKAYKKANKDPYAIVISKKMNKYKSEKESLDLAKSMNCSNRSYLKILISEKQNMDYYTSQKMDLDEVFTRINS